VKYRPFIFAEAWELTHSSHCLRCGCAATIVMIYLDNKNGQALHVLLTPALLKYGVKTKQVNKRLIELQDKKHLCSLWRKD